LSLSSPLFIVVIPPLFIIVIPTLHHSHQSTHDPPHEQLLMRLGVDGVLCGHPPSLSTCNPPYKQGLITVVAVASWHHCPVVIIVVVLWLVPKRLLATK
jgi:hypothetical protein